MDFGVVIVYICVVTEITVWPYIHVGERLQPIPWFKQHLDINLPFEPLYMGSTKPTTPLDWRWDGVLGFVALGLNLEFHSPSYLYCSKNVRWGWRYLIIGIFTILLPYPFVTMRIFHSHVLAKPRWSWVNSQGNARQNKDVAPKEKFFD